jgi:streptogramin lyase
VRSVHPRTGLISTHAGTGDKGYSGDGGPARSATFNGPKELAVDRSGNLWIVDTENHAFRFIDKVTGRVRTIAGVGRSGGAGDGGPAMRAQLDRPHGVAIGPDHTIWIADTNNHRLRVIRAGIP